MRLVLLRLLGNQRALYDQPRDLQRFRNYLAQIQADKETLAWFLSPMNPMGKDRAKAAYDALLALRAEDVAQAALEEAAPRLARVEGAVKVALAVQDDAQGAWSQPEPNEARHWQGAALAERGLCPVLFLSSRAPYSAQDVRRAVLLGVYRTAHQQRHGAPRALRDVLAQEGRAQLFAGEPSPLDDAQTAHARAVLAPHLDARADWPETFAAMFGDASAAAWGHKPLGLPPRAGFAVALADARASGRAPEDWL